MIMTRELMSPEAYMHLALKQAKKATEYDEVPIGAVLVDRQSGDVVAESFNQTITLSDPTAHAEILVIRDLCRKKSSQRIPDHDLYVTLEPCSMCASAISFARIHDVYFGAYDPKSGGICQGAKIFDHAQTHFKPKVTGGVLREECATLLKNFFKAKR